MSTQNHWNKGGVTAHIHEDGSLEIVGTFGNGLGQALARDLFEFLDAWYGNSTPEKAEEPAVVTASADLKPASIAEVAETAATLLDELAKTELPEHPAPKRRPGRPRKDATGGADGGA